jgi:predicted esterase
MFMSRSTIGGALAVAVFFVCLPARGDDSCESAGDGACDELSTCALGTDTADCEAACAQAWAPEILGACAHYAAVAARALPPPEDTGSHGEGGPVGIWTGTIEGRDNAGTSSIVRHFLVYVPPTYDPRAPAPLVYMLGGFTVDMYGLPAYTELMRTADLGGFIVVFPQQHFYDFGPATGWVFAWNVFSTDWVPAGDWQENPDIDFIRNLTAKLKTLYNVDRTRIFTSGHSRGAAMSVILAFELPDLVAGFCPQDGWLDLPGNAIDYFTRFQQYDGTRKIPAVIVGGEEDMDVGVAASDDMAAALEAAGWVEDEDFLYLRLANVAHEWQPQYNQVVVDFLFEHPLPIDEAAP